MPVFSYLVAPKEAGMRLDRFLKEKLPTCSRERLKTAIKQGQLLCEDTILTEPDFRLVCGTKLTLRLEEEESHLTAEEGDVELIYEDSALIVVNKPAHLTVHPCPSCPEKTLLQRLLSHFPQLKKMEGLRPGIVHRIDKDTSGLLLVALTEPVRLALTEAFAKRSVKKAYLAIVHGKTELHGDCAEPLGRHPTLKTKMTVLSENKGGKAARTHFDRLIYFPACNCSLVRVQIETGRTHQIRVHLSHLGHPLLGDCLYAPKEIADKAPRQMLHAWKISFTHPVLGTTLSLQAPPPQDFLDTCLRASCSLQRIVLTGNPGSGKSTVAAAFAKRNIPTFSADAEVQALYAPKGPVTEWLASHGFQDLLNADGVNRKALLCALTNPLFKRDLETMVHGAIRKALENFWNEQERLGHAQAVAEIPLWFECGWQWDPQPITICVFAAQQIRIERLTQTRGWSLEKCAKIEAWQWEGERKKKACDLVINNEGDTQALSYEIEACFKTLLCMQKERRKRLENHLALLLNKDSALSSQS